MDLIHTADHLSLFAHGCYDESTEMFKVVEKKAVQCMVVSVKAVCTIYASAHLLIVIVFVFLLMLLFCFFLPSTLLKFPHCGTNKGLSYLICTVRKHVSLYNEILPLLTAMNARKKIQLNPHSI